jgi:hypothetical protein
MKKVFTALIIIAYFLVGYAVPLKTVESSRSTGEYLCNAQAHPAHPARSKSSWKSRGHVLPIATVPNSEHQALNPWFKPIPVERNAPTVNLAATFSIAKGLALLRDLRSPPYSS